MIEQLSELEVRLLNNWQRNFPVSSRPYAEIAAEEGASEEEVIKGFAHLAERRMLSRIGATYCTGRAGASVLAAVAVEPDKLEKVAAQINSFAGVNHNYERSNPLNLWFVATAADAETLDSTLEEIERKIEHEVLIMPMVEAYRLDLGFRVT
ncbi:Lrp/AsnC family transcriptional regulator [Kiloniella laminariae]|uniref:Lrp/AsnC family transcriptional regulator n=1 Tax=Kiloniella laminariae TaxID=454162 RepID=UPI0003645394|nr:Lrp/AsnC family transcriptional regulator [Kiloniella laminariae]